MAGNSVGKNLQSVINSYITVLSVVVSVDGEFGISELETSL